jgi:hypothetical protein
MIRALVFLLSDSIKNGGITHPLLNKVILNVMDMHQ